MNGYFFMDLYLLIHYGFSANKARDEQIQCFYQLIQQLPTENYDTLKYLMQHLDR